MGILFAGRTSEQRSCLVGAQEMEGRTGDDGQPPCFPGQRFSVYAFSTPPPTPAPSAKLVSAAEESGLEILFPMK